jgi:hypothetical protein
MDDSSSPFSSNFEDLGGPAPTEDDIRGMADVAINATVSSLGDPPGLVSGTIRACQSVLCDVTEIRSGQGLQVGDHIELEVPVSGLSERSILQDGMPALDPSLFAPGAPFAAWAKSSGDRWYALLVDIERSAVAGAQY